MQLSLVSSLPASYYNELERLVFFNPCQAHAKGAIVKALELYGSPTIVADSKGIHLVVRGNAHVQSLFGIVHGRRRLTIAGMVMYVRASREELVVVHIAIAARYSRRKRTSRAVVIPLVRAVRAAAKRLRGVERMTLLYREGRFFRIPIKASTSANASTAEARQDSSSCAS